MAVKGKRLALAFLGVSLNSWAVHGTSSAADLKVTDLMGVTVEMKDVAIDYTIGHVVMDRDLEQQGIRVKSAEGTLTIPWENLRTIEMTWGRKAKLTTAKGEVQEVVLIIPYRGLTGQTDLGKVSMDWEHIEAIEVIKP